jgi:hypothetical protein
MVPKFTKKEKEKAHWASSFTLVLQTPFGSNFQFQFFPTFTPTKTPKFST